MSNVFSELFCLLFSAVFTSNVEHTSSQPIFISRKFFISFWQKKCIPYTVFKSRKPKKLCPLNSAYDESYSVKEKLPNQNKAVILAMGSNINEQYDLLS